jgi:N-acetylglutamate synthase-like GNAT family acetyltransferase
MVRAPLSAPAFICPKLDLMNTTIRPATRADAEAIVDLVESAYRGPRSRSGWTTEADLLDGQRTDLSAVADALDRDDVQTLVAASGSGELLGCCQLERRGERLAYFGSFAVAPTLQGGGLGGRLLAAAEREAARLWNSAELEMAVIGQRTELIDWYLRRGYEPSGETRPFPYGDERAGLPRRPDLHFVVLRKALA